MMGGRGPESMTEEQAYLILAHQSLREQRRRKASAYDAGEEEGEEEGAFELSKVLEALGGVGSTGLRKAIDVFRELDMDGDGEVTKEDFYERLMELGVEDFTTPNYSQLREEIDKLFDEIDAKYAARQETHRETPRDPQRAPEPPRSPQRLVVRLDRPTRPCPRMHMLTQPATTLCASCLVSRVSCVVSRASCAAATAASATTS